MVSKNSLILWFSEVGKEDVSKVGGKGANLGELTKAGFPVPLGFIVTAQAYFDYLKNTGLNKKISKILEGLDFDNSHDLQERAKRIQKLILKTSLPKKLQKEIIKNYQKLKKETNSKKLYVAVRSSATAEDLATASFAGQQATYLNVLGEKAVLEAVLKCWASLFEARAIYYRHNKGFDQLSVGIAVPIQKMVNSDVAGVMFTIDPTDNNLDHISIDAAYGLGEVVVLGLVTPDHYLVSKKDKRIISKEISKQTWMLTRESRTSDTEDPALLAKNGIKVSLKKQNVQKISDEEILKLAELGIRIEKHYGAPQDTEWAIENGKIYMVQSRPVTTLRKDKKEELKKIKEAKVILKGAGASVGIASGPVKIIWSPEEIDKIEKGDILVTEMTNPDYVPAMKKAVAVVTDKGGRTSHAAIVSRELGIPCVVGTGNATKVLKNISYITVDGSKGLVYEGKVETEKAQKESVEIKGNFYKETEPITATKIYVNLGEPELASEIAKRNIDGVGLLRAEFIIAENIKEHPKKMLNEDRGREFIDKLASNLEIFAREFYPRPVVYRATDFKTNEYKNLPGGKEFEPDEENPMIGYRGCFRYIKEPEIFNLELEALKKVRKNFSNLYLMIPFVRRLDEFQKVKKLIEKSGLLQSKDFKLWIMVEVPSVVFLIEDFCKEGIDGVSIGSNDLTQLILGLDRDSSIVAEEYDERNEAVLKAMKGVIETCKRYGVTVSICGQAPSVYPEITEKLVQFGITSISVNPDVIEQTRRIVASAEEKILLKELSEVKEELDEVKRELKERKKEK